MKIYILFLFLLIISVRSEPTKNIKEILPSMVESARRILRGNDVGDTRPYMVYLRPAAQGAEPITVDANWLCGGVIIHERYILTSAACIEDVKHFYVISGTHKLTDGACITNGGKRAVWKCVPKSYYFDGSEFDNIRWMSNDIAIVKVEDEFNFKKRIKGCDFIPMPIAYNNQSDDLTKPGTMASIAGWGSIDKYGGLTRRTNSPELQETDVILISKKNCKKRWNERYHYIIDETMICAKDSMDDSMSTLCADNEVNCKELVYSDEDERNARRFVINPAVLAVHSANHPNETRRTKVQTGGFCENDHGGPLVVGQGKGSIVVGIISACLTRDITKQCYGPFLFTSVFKNRNLINCAIYKDIGATCRKLLRTTKTKIIETLFSWGHQPDAPMGFRNRDDQRSFRRSQEVRNNNKTGTDDFI